MTMAHTYVSSLYHCIFSTKYRQPVIHPEMRERLWMYMTGIAREHRIKSLGIGGVADHVHLLISLPSSVSLAQSMQWIKGGSSRWVNKTFKSSHLFQWQEAYGGFSIGISQIDDTLDYIRHQEKHHRIKTFEEEYRAFIERHGLVVDERFLYG